jgi:hypothetical protein
MTNAVLMNPNSSAPHISFYEESVKDNEASKEDGQARFKNVYMIRVRQVGSKDFIVKNADEWLEHIEKIKQFPPDWISAFKRGYEAYKNDQEIPVEGFAIKMWPAINKAMADTVLAAGVRTVEELAAANEETLKRIGIGARQLQNDARAWRDSAKNTGIVSTELSNLRAENEQRKEREKDLLTRIDELARQVQGLQRTTKPQEDDFLSTGT